MINQLIRDWDTNLADSTAAIGGGLIHR